jgi:hypothetical protein
LWCTGNDGCRRLVCYTNAKAIEAPDEYAPTLSWHFHSF